MTVDLPTGAAVTLEHFEAVDAKGNYFNNIDSAMGITKQKDVFISDGTPQTFEARFTFHGFRYLRVSGSCFFHLHFFLKKSNFLIFPYSNIIILIALFAVSTSFNIAQS